MEARKRWSLNLTLHCYDHRAVRYYEYTGSPRYENVLAYTLYRYGAIILVHLPVSVSGDGRLRKRSNETTHNVK